jgi:hypothetical protein
MVQNVSWLLARGFGLLQVNQDMIKKCSFFFTLNFFFSISYLTLCVK